MKGKKTKSLELRLKRKKRIRTQIVGTTQRPRLCVYRSNKHIYAQLINDAEGKTLAALSTKSVTLKDALEGTMVDKAKKVGLELAKICVEKGVEKVIFDRNGFIFHKGGRIAAVATGAREGGLKF